MAAVLGIDAAWTITQPSGVAVAVQRNGQWRLLAAAASYEDFLDHGRSPAHDNHIGGGAPIAADLLVTAQAIAQEPMTVVAVDIPIARTPITSRRYSDDAVSRVFGGRGCGTHTPSSTRPGAISGMFVGGFGAAGYELATTVPIRRPSLIEVYPHPALLHLVQADYRVPYKQGKTGKYWPGLSPSLRRERLIRVWADIVERLDREVAGAAAMLSLPASSSTGRQLKGFEDKLDAVVCAWIGICAIEDRAEAHGDHDSAIWAPAVMTPVTAR